MLDELLAGPLPWLPVLMEPPMVTQSTAGAVSSVRPFSQSALWICSRVTPASHVRVRFLTSISRMRLRYFVVIMTSGEYHRVFHEV